MNIKSAVNRFLSWPLPKDFAPDCHIRFDRDSASCNQHSWPDGTNLLHAGQAEDMIRHIMTPAPEELTDFGGAVAALKAGKSVAREGWNGKGMFLYLVKSADLQNGLKYGYGEYQGKPNFVSSIAMKTAQNTIVVGWLASQTDMLAEDWMVLE